MSSPANSGQPPAFPPPTFPPAAVPARQFAPRPAAVPVNYPAAPSYPPGRPQPFAATSRPAVYQSPGGQPAYSSQAGGQPRPVSQAPARYAAPTAQDRSPHLVDMAYGKKRRRNPVLRWMLRLLLIASLLVGGIMVYDILRARAALLHMVDTAAAVNLELLDNRSEADRLVQTFQRDAATAANSLSGPLWDAATILPGIGDDIAAVQIITATFSDLSVTGFPELLDAAITTRNLSLDTLDLNAIGYTLEQVQISDRALADSINQLEQIDSAGLMPQLAELTDNVIIQLQELRKATAPIASIGELATAAHQLLPGLFG